MSVVSPWHMWGSEGTIECVSGVVAATPSRPVNAQLARVNYRRPETWGFIFSAEVVAAPASTVADFYIQVNFNVMAGVGRSVWVSGGPRTLDYDTLGPEAAFAKFQWYSASGARTWRKKWTSIAVSPVLVESATPAEVVNGRDTSFIVADSIQCEASVAAISTGADGPLPVKVSVGAYFAPLNHVRPDWFCKNFTGETGGK